MWQAILKSNRAGVENIEHIFHNKCAEPHQPHLHIVKKFNPARSDLQEAIRHGFILSSPATLSTSAFQDLSEAHLEGGLSAVFISCGTSTHPGAPHTSRSVKYYGTCCNLRKCFANDDSVCPKQHTREPIASPGDSTRWGLARLRRNRATIELTAASGSPAARMWGPRYHLLASLAFLPC